MYDTILYVNNKEEESYVEEVVWSHPVNDAQRERDRER